MSFWISAKSPGLLDSPSGPFSFHSLPSKALAKETGSNFPEKHELFQHVFSPIWTLGQLCSKSLPLKWVVQLSDFMGRSDARVTER